MDSNHRLFDSQPNALIDRATETDLTSCHVINPQGTFSYHCHAGILLAI